MSRSPTSTGGPEDLWTWYGELLDTLGRKPPEDLARELPGLAKKVTELAANEDDLAIGVSFSKRFTGLDYSIHRIIGDDNPYLEPIKEPVTETHRYVDFRHPPDPHFTPAALRARLLAAVQRERQELDRSESGFAALWGTL